MVILTKLVAFDYTAQRWVSGQHAATLHLHMLTRARHYSAARQPAPDPIVWANIDTDEDTALAILSLPTREPAPRGFECGPRGCQVITPV